MSKDASRLVIAGKDITMSTIEIHGARPEMIEPDPEYDAEVQALIDREELSDTPAGRLLDLARVAREHLEAIRAEDFAASPFTPQEVREVFSRTAGVAESMSARMRGAN